MGVLNEKNHVEHFEEHHELTSRDVAISHLIILNEHFSEDLLERRVTKIINEELFINLSK